MQHGLARRGEPALQEAARGRAFVARPHIGPGAAALLAFAGRLAGGAGRIGRHLEIAQVAADAVDAELDRPSRGSITPAPRTPDTQHAFSTRGVTCDLSQQIALVPPGPG